MDLSALNDFQPKRPPPETGPLGGLSRLLGHFRFAFMPLGLCALVAVGVHAGADSACDRLLWAVDRADAALDAFFGQFPLTAPLVSWVGLEERNRIARALALLWELGADLVLALPALGYRESDPLQLRFATEGWRQVLGRVLTRPTTLRWTRPACTAAVAVAGACAVARMVEGELYFALGDGRLAEWAGRLARFGALMALGSVLVSLGWRAVLRSLQHADSASEALPDHPMPGRAFTEGLVGAALCVPLALSAALYASPVLSFFR